MTRIAEVAPEHATGAVSETYAAIARTLGRVPNMARVMGTQPIYLDIYMMMRAKIAEGRLDARIREAIAVTISAENGCDYCEAAHATTAIRAFDTPGDEVDAWRCATSSDPALAPVLALARRLNETRGALEDGDLEAARAAGLSDADIIEVLGVVVMNIATNYLNRLARTDLDFPSPQDVVK
ncbi:carboxymuconolactone decarboxylase family protein [Litoreibacter roseus]|uniref:Alkyl hydroperoxide reductase AhpD n=1 Tax=Litoreibacter roseus TaxID=2601869 RepID=A0A6N6JHJ0_9RHOB|nr:carboxymuconolactone decarboxylase family protein [Litoreibacter roseus]GFE65716.1 alkyl hydroperoxide reductase AhpD [Litoreibacter roseus]